MYVFVALWGTLGLQLGAPGLLRATFGLPLGTLGRYFGDLGTSCWLLFATLGRALDSLKPFCRKCSKKVPKMTQNESPGESIFHDILSFCRKWQTAFGPRRRGPIEVWASRFQSLGLRWRPWFYQRFFDVFWGVPGTSFHSSAAEAAPPIIDYWNIDLEF